MFAAIVLAAATALTWVHRPVAATPGAQVLFDQGLTLAYAYNRDAAANRFRAALDLDPQCAMCAWGVALATGKNLNYDNTPKRNARALPMLAKAEANKGRESAVNAGLIDALQKRFADPYPSDPHKLDVAYLGAMKTLAAKYPDDPDVVGLYAEAELIAGAPGDVKHVEAALDRAIALHKDHLGLAHFNIHVREDNDPMGALASVKVLENANLDPAASHLRHMPGHVDIHIGDWADLARENDAAVAMDDTFAHGGDPWRELEYYGHNLDFAMGGALMLGRTAHATALLAKLKTAPSPGRQVFAASVRLGLWDEILALPMPSDYQHATARYARACALAAVGNPDASELELQRLKSTAGHEKDATDNTVDQAFADAAEGRIALVHGDAKTAATQFASGANLIRDIDYERVEPWYLPLRMWEGAALLRAGDAPGAERAFRTWLTQWPKDPRGMYGLAMSLRAQGKPDVALERQAAEAWNGADTPLTPARLLE